MKIKLLKKLNIKSLSLRKKLIIFFSFVVIIPITLILVFTYINQTEETEKNVRRSTQVIVNQAASNIMYYINDANELINSVFLNDSVKKQIQIISDEDSNAYERIVAENNIQDQLKSFVRTKDYIKSFYIIDSKENIYSYGDYVDFKTLDQNDWFTDVYSGRQKKVYKAIVDEENSDDESKIVVLMKYIDYNAHEQLGVIGIEIQYSFIESILKNINEYPNSETFIVDDDKAFGTGRNTDIGTYNVEADMQNGVGDIISGNKLIVYGSLGMSGWKLVQINDLHQIMAAHRETIRMTLIIGLLFLAIAEALAIGISYQISKPIKDLKKQMMKVEIGEFDSRVEIMQEDEIGQLSYRFNKMVDKLDEQIHRIQRDEKEKREIEMQLLQEQINPHFLYNTLNSMVWLSRIQKTPTMTAGLKSLIFILKNVIHDGNEYITLRKEIDFIKNYVVIQKLRYGEKFDIEFFIDEKLKDNKVLKLMIQPIIENAILHGFENKGFDNKINIYVENQNNSLKICVEDNGVGMSEDEIEKLLKKERRRDGGLHQFGIYNITQRLNLYYLNEAKLWIESKPGQGTRVYLILPIID